LIAYALTTANQRPLEQAAGVLIFSHLAKGGAGLGERSEISGFMARRVLERCTHSDGWSVGADDAVAAVSPGAEDQFNAA
jgi:hypothetical protein